MNQLASCVVSHYIHQNFMPATQKAIQQAIANKKAQLIVPALITNKFLSSIVEPSLQNASHRPFYPSVASPIVQTPQISKQPESIRVPYRKHRSILSKPTPNAKSIHEQIEKRSARSNSRITTQSTALIKLPSQNEQEDEDVTKIRKMKALSKKFEKMKEQNRLYNEKMYRLAKYHKQSSLNECPYHNHTYNYQADIVGMAPSSLSDFPQPLEEKSLLEIIKNNLDKELDNERINKKIEEINQITAKQRSSEIALGHISRLEEVDGNYLPVKKNQPPEAKNFVERALKPPFNFQKSSIRSLTKNIEDSFISEGVKMITHEHHIVQEKSKRGPLFRIQEEDIVKQKPRGRKQKTNTSQSVIYSLQNELKNQSVLDYFTNPIRQSSLQQRSSYQSLQHNRQQENQQYEALTQLLKRHSKHITLDIQSRVEYSHLPFINRPQHRSHLKKRTPTQKKLKGLQGIEVKVSTPQLSQDVHFSHRSAQNSPLAINKHTESSLEEAEYDCRGSRQSSQKSKKQLVRGYFRNYKQQFRHKLKGMEQALGHYS